MEEYLLVLADQAPQLLARLLNEGLLDNVDISLAAEAMGRAEDRSLVRNSLIPLLKHHSALVREGAIYGLANELDLTGVRAAVEIIANTDQHPGVRRAALAVLMD